jgi:hypothetical protein
VSPPELARVRLERTEDPAVQRLQPIRAARGDEFRVISTEFDLQFVKYVISKFEWSETLHFCFSYHFEISVRLF